MLEKLNGSYRSDLLLELLDEFDHQLTVLGASKNEIIDLIIASKNKDNLQAFYNNLVNLKNKEYTISTCIEIIKKSPSGLLIKRLIQFHDTLKEMGYKPHDIIKLAIRENRSTDLKAIIKQHNTLAAKSFGYQPHDIIRLVTHQGGPLNLQAIIKHYKTLIDLGYKPHDIIRLANHSGGSINLQAVIDHHKTLIRDDFGYQIHDIVRLAAHNGGSVNLQAVVRHYQTLIKLGYNRHNI
ncbi:hypothetical protein DA717_14910, partial [Piscirickettsiaceae bacterium NZ-RLO2]